MGLIFLLEDNPARLAEMLTVLRRDFPAHPVHVTDDDAEAIAYLTAHLPDIDLISLDHDLDSVPRPHERNAPIDHGHGRTVANFLASIPPTCPIIIDSANDHAATGMFYELKHQGWPAFRVYPRDHHTWVATDWRATLQTLKSKGWL